MRVCEGDGRRWGELEGLDASWESQTAQGGQGGGGRESGGGLGSRCGKWRPKGWGGGWVLNGLWSENDELA